MTADVPVNTNSGAARLDQREGSLAKPGDPLLSPHVVVLVEVAEADAGALGAVALVVDGQALVPDAAQLRILRQRKQPQAVLVGGVPRLAPPHAAVVVVRALRLPGAGSWHDDRHTIP